VPEDKEKDVYAWAHDKAVEVLIKFDAEAINAFEESVDCLHASLHDTG
jgi:hypothetical protein